MNGRALLRILRRRATRLGVELREVESSGSHVKIWFDGRRSAIPIHGEDLKTGTFRGILKALGMKPDDLKED